MFGSIINVNKGFNIYFRWWYLSKQRQKVAFYIKKQERRDQVQPLKFNTSKNPSNLCFCL